jgi:hypothetical protein
MPTVTTPFIEGGIFRELVSDPSPISTALVAEAARVADHGLYRTVRSLDEVRRFMEFHVWCVWDFMSLAKSVQLAVGAYSVPWIPPGDASLVSAIDEIIGDEEADIGPAGTYQSHFEIYLDAMRQAKADPRCIENSLRLVKSGTGVNEAMELSHAPAAAMRFVSNTMRICAGPAHVRVGAFCLAREELVPTMFTTFLRYLPSDNPSLSSFMWYIRRHVDLDSHLHGPLSARLFRATVGNNPRTRQEALEAALTAVRARGSYLDETLAAVLAQGPKQGSSRS